jgi:hypothetical protein
MEELEADQRADSIRVSNMQNLNKRWN